MRCVGCAYMALLVCKLFECPEHSGDLEATDEQLCLCGCASVRIHKDYSGSVMVCVQGNSVQKHI